EVPNGSRVLLRSPGMTAERLEFDFGNPASALAARRPAQGLEAVAGLAPALLAEAALDLVLCRAPMGGGGLDRGPALLGHGVDGGAAAAFDRLDHAFGGEQLEIARQRGSLEREALRQLGDRLPLAGAQRREENELGDLEPARAHRLVIGPG